jgi:DNA polymerase alpha subunit B
VKRDKPHVLILMGPFLDAKSSDLKDGDISYVEPSGELTFLDYQDLMDTLMKLIRTELSSQKTEVVLIPSAREINHIYPLPQPAY